LFDPAHGIIWLTPPFSYLTRVERRLANVERLFSQLLPDVDINEALASRGVEAPADASQPNASLSPPINLTSPDNAISPDSPLQLGGAISDAVPAEVDGFDWQEDVDELTDGMASLSVEPRGAGYLGKSLSPDINTQNIKSF
jgi:transcriptional regulatory protein GAL4